MTSTRTWPSIALLAALALLATACAPAAPAGNAGEPVKNADGYTDVTVDQLSDMLAEKDFALVNVHIPYQGELPQTDLFIPYDEILQHLDELPARDAPIVLYCRSGSMSTTAAEDLAEAGYTDVYELDGGFNAWRDAGYEFIDNQ